MAPAYLVSETQRALLAHIAGLDRTAADFFLVAPIVIDRGGDAPAFRAALTPVQQEAIPAWHARGKLRSVGDLARPAHDYAIRQVREIYAALDDDARDAVRALLEDWRLERGRAAGQASKGERPIHAAGIDIILPLSGIRLGYQVSDLIQFAG